MRDEVDRDYEEIVLAAHLINRAVHDIMEGIIDRIPNDDKDERPAWVPG